MSTDLPEKKEAYCSQKYSTDSTSCYSNLIINKKHECVKDVILSQAGGYYGAKVRKEDVKDNSYYSNTSKSSVKYFLEKDKSYLSRMVIDEKKGKIKPEPNSEKSSSTLSLHIAAYEATAESSENAQQLDANIPNEHVQKKLCNNGKQFVKNAGYTDTDCFEFPRQQEEEPSTPEVAQFTATQQLFSPSQSQSTPRGRPRGALSKKTYISEVRSAVSFKKYTSSVVDTMTPTQRTHYDLSVAKVESLQNELQDKENAIQKMKDELEASQEAEKNSAVKFESERRRRLELEKQLEDQEKMYKAKIESLKLRHREEERIAKKKFDDLLNLLKQKSNELQILQKTLEKMKVSFSEMVGSNRLLRIEVGGLQHDIEKLQKNNEYLVGALASANESKEKVLSRVAKMRCVRNARKAPLRYTPYPVASDRTQRRRVEKIVKEVNQIPQLKDKVMAHLSPKIVAEKRKLTPLQAIAMAVSLGFHQNQLEQMKTYLRLLGLDILPPVPAMRKALSKIKQAVDCETVYDKDLGIYSRRILSVWYGLKTRTEMLWESGKFVEIPGFEDYVFYGLTVDSGGGYLEAGISCCNVSEGWASPNNIQIIVTAKVPKEDYKHVKSCCGTTFDQVNKLNGKRLEYNFGGATVTKTIIFIVCMDGKISCICSGHCGSTSSNPCYSCSCTKKEINEGKHSPLRDTVTMLKQAAEFHRKRAESPNAPENVLTKWRSESESITEPPLITIPKDQWVFGILHAISGPVIKVLKIVEDDALKLDLNDLQITVPTTKESRQQQIKLNNEIAELKSYILELQKALHEAKLVKPKWKAQRRKPVVEHELNCAAPRCLQSVLDPSLLKTILKCKCGKYIHSACDLLFASHELEYARVTSYDCPACEGLSDSAALSDIESREREWQHDLERLKNLLIEKEKEAKATKTPIPFEKCHRYKKIEQKLKELKVRKNLYFQTLNGIDVRNLVKNGDSFCEALREELQGDVRSLLQCLNAYQELSSPQILTDDDLKRLNPEELKRSYQALCGNDLTPKIHHLCTHSIEFMAKFHFYQLANDHGIEHIHHIVKLLLQKYCINKDQPEQALKVITDNFCIRNKLFDLGINIGNLRGLSLDEKNNLINKLE